MPTLEPQEATFAIRGPIARADLPGLCDRVCAILREAGPGVVVRCDVKGVEPDAVCVDALARLHLAALRRGCCVRLESVSDELLRLVELMGLTQVLCTGGTPAFRLSGGVEDSQHGELHAHEPR